MRKNIETSVEAYKSLDPKKLTETYREILFALSVIKEGTYEDISSHLKAPPSKIWKRLSELNNAGFIYRPGNKRPLKSGRQGYTWMLVQKGVSPRRVTEKLLTGKTVADYSMEILGHQQELFENKDLDRNSFLP